MQLEGSDPCRMFECRTCNRKFQSFQALGGHRASHEKLRLIEEGSGTCKMMMRAHECSVCGLEFAIGQALGGHMRRHRSSNERELGFRGKKSRVMCFDLNLPPPEEDNTDDQCCNKYGVN